MAAIFNKKTMTQIADIERLAKSEDFVANCEKEYERRICNAAHTIIDSGARVVLLTGPSSSGKTTTSKKIEKELERLGKSTVTLSLDDFLKDAADYPLLPDGTPDYESDETINMPLFNEAVNTILKTGEFDCPTYDWANRISVKGEHVSAEPGSIIIAEGIHALNPKASCDITAGKVFKVYASIRNEYYVGNERILSTREIRIVRRMLRDEKFRSCSIEATLEMWNNILRGEELYIKPNKRYADLILDTSFACEVPVFLPAFSKAVENKENGGKHRETLEKLYAKYSMFPSLSEDLVPQNSMLREFLGGLEL